MRPIALNRKNALFAGSDEGAENWAMLASLIETCKLHGVNPRSLPDRRADQARQQLAQQPARRTHALGLGCRNPLNIGPLGRNRAVKPHRWWAQRTAYSSARASEVYRFW